MICSQTRASDAGEKGSRWARTAWRVSSAMRSALIAPAVIEPETADRRIYVIDQGTVAESGAYDELMRAGGRFAQIFAEQA